MKKIINFIISPKATMILMFLFALSIGTGTFIEDRYDTITSKLLVYNAKWFEFLFLFLIINFIGLFASRNLFRKDKIAGLILHSAFVIMIIGAGVTRFTGFEGTMHIRQGETSNFIFSEKPYLQIQTGDNTQNFEYKFPLQLSEVVENNFSYDIKTQSEEQINISFKNYYANSIDEIIENTEGGNDMLDLVVSISNQRQNILISDGEMKTQEGEQISFNNKNIEKGVRIFKESDNLYIKADSNIITTSMDNMKTDTISKDSLLLFQKRKLYNTGGVLLVLSNSYKKAKKQIKRADVQTGISALLLDITKENKTETVTILGGNESVSDFKDYNIEGTILRIAFGKMPIKLPFAIRLKNFDLERYPGSNSPSSYASEVVLIDERNSLNKDYRIFMNNVLDYDGYRFFQSSYDPDEMGTILSVNHDFAGTWITYLSYFLMALGFVVIPFTNNSRFFDLRKKIKILQAERKAGLITLFILFFSISGSFAQTTNHQEVSKEHAEKFGELVVQTYSGRFAPLHTLATDVMMKISRKDDYEIEGKGKVTAIQAFMDIMINPQIWQKKKIILVKEPPVRDVLGITGEYATFLDFFNSDNQYKLKAYSEEAFRKKQSDQNKFDKEIVKLDERLNIFMMIYQGEMLKIFPSQKSEEIKWITPNDSASYIPLKGNVEMLNKELKLSSFTYRNLLELYLNEVVKATENSDYSTADKILNFIKTIQREGASEKVIPSKKMVSWEIFYNKLNIFKLLKSVYALLSILILLFSFIENLSSKKRKIIKYLLNISIILLAGGFLLHTFGMGLRWYLTGHAPWSNGYEALLLAGWGGLIAGFSFARSSKVVLGASALVGFFLLMTAGHSSYDPQLTNLQPVLKSYWLIIHVATLTISYGFLGSSFILGIINLLLSSFKNANNQIRLSSVVKELTYINEMLVNLGLVLATIGTFLGGIWANESWGRYWGWDAKETWALVIVIVYAMIIHFRFIPKLNSALVFNISSVFSFSTVLMTFIGVNYYFTKGLHSYGQGSTPVFPIWAWIAIFSTIALAVIASLNEKKFKNPNADKEKLDK